MIYENIITETASAWQAYERRLSLVDPSSVNNNLNAIWAVARGSTGINDYERGTARTARWRCSYCGGSRAVDLDNCPGCGAGRVE